MTVAASKCTIVDSGGTIVPVEFAAPLDIRFTRGVEPYSFAYLSTVSLASLRNPVTFNLEAARGRNVQVADNARIANWWLTSEEQGPRGFVRCYFADGRWPLLYAKHTGQYNIVSYGGRYRPASIVAGTGTGWTAYEVVEDILKSLGATDVRTDEEVKLAAVPCPDNLVNHSAGILFGAALREILPVLLETMKADLVPHPDGAMVVVGRRRDHARALYNATDRPIGGDWTSVGGAPVATPRNVALQRPKQLRVEFMRRVQRRFSLDLGGTSASGGDMELENVAPTYSTTSGVEATFAPIANVASRSPLGLTLTQVRERLFKPTMFDGRNLQPAQREEATALANIVRQHYRRTFRVLARTDAQLITRARLADLVFGNLRADGTTDPRGITGRWCERLRFGERGVGAAGSITADAVWAKNHEDGPTPFEATWLDRGDGVFTIDDGRTSPLAGVAYLGQFEALPKMPSIAEMFRNGVIDFEEHGRLSSRVQAFVYYHGAQVGPDPPGAQPPLGTTYPRAPQSVGVDAIELGLFADGQIEWLVLRVEDLTANYAYAAQWPGTLLNFTEINDRAHQIAARVVESYQNGESGVLVFSGVEQVRRNTATVAGNVYEVAVVVGEQGFITTTCTVLSGIVSTSEAPERKAEPPMRFL